MRVPRRSACADVSLALTRAELYQATVPVADRSEASQAAAFEAALKIVLVRVTGRRAAEEDPALAPLVANARRYVQQYRAAPDNQLWVAFDSAAIDRWLTQNDQPIWGRERPSTYVWLAVQTAAPIRNGHHLGGHLRAQGDHRCRRARARRAGALAERGGPFAEITSTTRRS